MAAVSLPTVDMDMKKLLIAHCAVCLFVLLLLLLLGERLPSLFASPSDEKSISADLTDVAAEQDLPICSGAGGCGARLSPEYYSADSPLPPILL